jgi:hypothetical protein
MPPAIAKYPLSRLSGYSLSSRRRSWLNVDILKWVTDQPDGMRDQ